LSRQRADRPRSPSCAIDATYALVGAETDFVYPALSYTLSESDLVVPLDLNSE